MTPPTDHLDHPFRIAGSGRAAGTDDADHVRDLVMQLLLTEPGERLMRPDLGCGLRALVFDPHSDALAAATQTLVQGSLQHWLGERIALEAVEVVPIEERLEVRVAYQVRETGERRVDSVAAPAGAPA